jgi:hypothetical protein
MHSELKFDRVLVVLVNPILPSFECRFYDSIENTITTEILTGREKEIHWLGIFLFGLVISAMKCILLRADLFTIED